MTKEEMIIESNIAKDVELVKQVSTPQVTVNGEKIEIEVKLDASDLYRVMDQIVANVVQTVMENAGKSIEVNNYISIDGSQEPEEFAKRLTNQLKMDMRSL